MTGSQESISCTAEETGAHGRWVRLAEPVRSLFEERLPAGVGWAHVFGSTLLALIGIQVVTGVLLSLNYSASTSTAWESTRYIQDQVVFGGIIRGVHHWAASASIVVAALHVVRVFIYAAYRAPRQWTWVAGVLLLLVLLGFGLTGYLLPWDLKAYFGTQVATEIPGSIPVLGPYLLRLIRGSADVGPFTLTRFYAFHVIILPMMLTLLLTAHLYLVRRHGITPPWTRIGEEGRPGRVFFPYQAVKDSAAILVAVVLIFLLAVWIGAPLEEKADPTNSSYVPRPDWYFLGLQQLLRIFQGKWQILGTVVIPGLSVLVLLALPWLDRTPERRLRLRPIALSLGGICAAGVVAMTAAGYAAVRHEETRIVGVQVSPPPPADTYTEVAEASPELVGEGARLYGAMRCGSCHGPDRDEVMPGLPPDLSYAGSKLRQAWIRDYLLEPKPIRYESDGVRPTLRMPEFHFSATEATALAVYLSEQTDSARFPPLPSGRQPTPGQVEEGRQLFANYQCLGCHVLDSEGNRIGPDLTHVGARLRGEYLDVFLRNPEALIPGTSMKNFQLWDEEREALVAFLDSRK
ncbi:MAG: cytochrome b N-terminal domain-containing protein [Phycisphaerae bacterium]